jgi:GTP-binding protein YchF
MKAALVGLMQSGKSTILASISGKQSSAIGSTSIEEAVVPVPDERFDFLIKYCKPAKVVHATIDSLDTPGFNFTDDHGRAAARRLINKIRTIDLLVIVVRSFINPSVPAYRNRVNPLADLAELQTELLLADLELVTTRIDNLEKQINKPSKTQPRDKAELALQKKLQEAIESEKTISSVIETDAELELIKPLGFLTLKPMIVVVNVGEDQLEKKFDFSGRIDSSIPVTSFCGKLELELSQLDSESREEFKADLGIKESAASKFVNSCYSALGLISFLTIGPDEVRAWPIRKGTIAVEAAGKVHSDIQRGFIRAETFAYDDLIAHGDEKALKAAGKIRLEGKEYIVKDGDIINFRFNV